MPRRPTPKQRAVLEYLRDYEGIPVDSASALAEAEITNWLNEAAFVHRLLDHGWATLTITSKGKEALDEEWGAGHHPDPPTHHTK